MSRKADGPFELVIFDLDGVLVDSEPISSRVTAAALREAGVEISAADVCDRFLGVTTATMLRASIRFRFNLVEQPPSILQLMRLATGHFTATCSITCTQG